MKTVLVTGSSRGIGKSIALAFADAGYGIVLNGRTQSEALLETQRQITEKKVPCLALAGDVGNPSFCETLFHQIQKQMGAVDVLINNAGISHIGLLQDMTPQQWNHLIQTNLSSAFYCSRLAIPHMIAKQHGCILNISSVWGICGASCEAAYSASKGGLNALTRALAKELAPSGICVNAIACGAIDTEMNQFLSCEERSALLEEIPIGRMGRPGEVAKLALQLAQAPEYLTGQIIQLDGGWI